MNFKNYSTRCFVEVILVQSRWVYVFLAIQIKVNRNCEREGGGTQRNGKKLDTVHATVQHFGHDLAKTKLFHHICDSPTECRKTGHRMIERRKTGRRMAEHQTTERPNAERPNAELDPRPNKDPTLNDRTPNDRTPKGT